MLFQNLFCKLESGCKDKKKAKDDQYIYQVDNNSLLPYSRRLIAV
jgi:hypothetical protein